MIIGDSLNRGVPSPDTINRRQVGDIKRLYNSDGTWRDVICLLNDTGAATVVNQVVMIGFGASPASGLLAKTLAAVTVDVKIAVAESAIPFGDPGWFAIHGWVDALVEGTTDVAAGDALMVVVATDADAFVVDTSGANRTTRTGAFALAGQTANSAVLTRVLLLSDRCDVD